MQVVEGGHNLCRVEEGGGGVEPAGAPQVREKFPTAEGRVRYTGV